jgi:hypothetical protein
MLDSINALIWELEWNGPIEKIVFNPVLPPPANERSLVLANTNPQLLISPPICLGPIRSRFVGWNSTENADQHRLPSWLVQKSICRAKLQYRPVKIIKLRQHGGACLNSYR